ncbi:MAG: alpha-galactosidase, partial [Pseudomonadota bacterium]
MDEAFIAFTGQETSFVLDCGIGHRPGVLYWGPRLKNADGRQLKQMGFRQHAPGSADAEVAGSLLNEAGSGFLGPPGFYAHRSGEAWASILRVDRIERAGANEIKLICRDTATRVAAIHKLALNPHSDVLTCQTEIVNEGDTDLSIYWCASACLPVDPRMDRLFGFTGRWAGEFHIEEVPMYQGSYVRENRSGRTSHDTFPGLILAAPGTSEQAGSCYGFHLGWSGNARLRVDRLSDGRSFAQFGAYVFPGEVTLPPDGVYPTPPLYTAFSPNGRSALSRKFHAHLRQTILDNRTRSKPRPVHFNTWEAVYFDHAEDKLFALATAAAEVGAERFILDDGWFAGRRNAETGLGDWYPDTDVYPNGLSPLIAHVAGLGMEFGLWVEPEMVNPDSELFRAHPDWIL